MTYKVIVDFTDLQDNNRKYRVGDEFPRKGLSVSKERLDALSTTKNRRGFPVIEAEVEAEIEPEVEPELEAEIEIEEPKKEVKKSTSAKKTSGRKKANAE